MGIYYVRVFTLWFEGGRYGYVIYAKLLKCDDYEMGDFLLVMFGKTS